MEIKIRENSLRRACRAYITACDSMQCHIHLRIDGDGEAYVSLDPSYCIGHDEFNKLPECTITVRHQSGWGQNNLEPYWYIEPDGHEATEQLFESIIEDLKRDGYTVVMVPQHSCETCGIDTEEPTVLCDNCRLGWSYQ